MLLLGKSKDMNPLLSSLTRTIFFDKIYLILRIEFNQKIFYGFVLTTSNLFISFGTEEVNNIHICLFRHSRQKFTNNSQQI